VEGIVNQIYMTNSVSVVVPIFNRAHRIKTVVDSILAQTMPAEEVILVDDGSDDDTPDRIPVLVKENPHWLGRVVYIRQNNQGPSAARNSGVERARADWIAFNDSDDLWLPDKLEWQFRALKKVDHDCGACFTDAWFMNNPRMKASLFQMTGRNHREVFGVVGDILSYLHDKDPVFGLHPVWVQTLVARRKLIQDVGGFDPSLRCGEDDDFVFRLGCRTQFAFVGLPLVLIDRTTTERRHEGQSKDWDTQEFRLKMAERRFEKRFQMRQALPNHVNQAIRRDLAAVHSAWANLFVAKGEYLRARISVDNAAALHRSPGILLKWVLIRYVPKLALTLSSLRERRRVHKTEGIA
jgi:glycosyltransferase involved in cell wall biosynthesis